MTDQAVALSTIPALDVAMADTENWDATVRRCQYIISVGWCPSNIEKPEQLMAMVMHGRMLALTNWEAIQCLQMVQGHPTFKAKTLRGLLETRYQGCIQVLQSDEEACMIKVKVRDIETGGDAFVTESFTQQDAIKAGLIGGRNANWKKYPKDMLYARCIARVEKKHLPICPGADVWVAELVEPKAAPQTLGEV